MRAGSCTPAAVWWVGEPILGLRERGGRVRAMPVDAEDKSTIEGAVHRHVAPGSRLYTDEHSGYDGIDRAGYRHSSVRHSAKEYVTGMAHTNGMESVWSIIKRGYHGIYHGWSRKHCHQYVNEFTFRLNEGNVERDTQNRLDDLFQAMAGKTTTFRELTR